MLVVTLKANKKKVNFYTQIFASVDTTYTLTLICKPKKFQYTNEEGVVILQCSLGLLSCTFQFDINFYLTVSQTELAHHLLMEDNSH